jgi:hypothetical protein
VGLCHIGARPYDPALGLGTQPDTIVPNPPDPLSANRHSVAEGNPLGYGGVSRYRGYLVALLSVVCWLRVGIPGKQTGEEPRVGIVRREALQSGNLHPQGVVCFLA